MATPLTRNRKIPGKSCDKTNCDTLDIQKNMLFAVFNEN